MVQLLVNNHNNIKGSASKYSTITLVSSAEEGVDQLTVATNAINGNICNNSVLVSDLSSPEFRYKVVSEKFVQWIWHGDAFGIQCKSKEDATKFTEALRDLKRSHSSALQHRRFKNTFI
jgi:hypothetical protein